MTTALDIITDAATTAGVIDPNESLPQDQARFILRRFNRMIDSWSNERLMIYETYIDSLALTAGVASYSTALLAHGNARQWDNAYVRLSTIDYPLEFISQQDYNAIPYKPTSAIPTSIYVNTNWPDSTMYLFPVPFGTMTLYIGARQVLEANKTLADSIILPPGYEACLVDNLAVNIGPSFGLPPNQELRDMASNAKMVLKRNNYFPLNMVIDVPVGERLFNIYRGTNGT